MGQKTHKDTHTFNSHMCTYHTHNTHTHHMQYTSLTHTHTITVLYLLIFIVNFMLFSLTKLETENGYLNNPSSKHALFIFLPCSEKGCRQVEDLRYNYVCVFKPLPCHANHSQPSNQKMTKFKDRIRKCGVEGSAVSEVMWCVCR